MLVTSTPAGVLAGHVPRGVLTRLIAIKMSTAIDVHICSIPGIWYQVRHKSLLYVESIDTRRVEMIASTKDVRVFALYYKP